MFSPTQEILWYFVVMVIDAVLRLVCEVTSACWLTLADLNTPGWFLKRKQGCHGVEFRVHQVSWAPVSWTDAPCVVWFFSFINTTKTVKNRRNTTKTWQTQFSVSQSNKAVQKHPPPPQCPSSSSPSLSSRPPPPLPPPVRLCAALSLREEEDDEGCLSIRLSRVEILQSDLITKFILFLWRHRGQRSEVF